MMLAAQVVSQMASDMQPLAQYGLIGTVLGWFMYMATKVPDAIYKASTEATEKMQEEMKKVQDEMRAGAHRVDGLTRALLMDLVSRDSTGIQTKAHARQEIAKIEARLPR